MVVFTRSRELYRWPPGFFPSVFPRFEAVRLDGLGRHIGHSDTQVQFLITVLAMPGTLKDSGLHLLPHYVVAFLMLAAISSSVDSRLAPRFSFSALPISSLTHIMLTNSPPRCDTLLFQHSTIASRIKPRAT